MDGGKAADHDGQSMTLSAILCFVVLQAAFGRARSDPCAVHPQAGLADHRDILSIQRR